MVPAQKKPGQGPGFLDCFKFEELAECLELNSRNSQNLLKKKGPPQFRISSFVGIQF